MRGFARSGRGPIEITGRTDRHHSLYGQMLATFNRPIRCRCPLSPSRIHEADGPHRKLFVPEEQLSPRLLPSRQNVMARLAIVRWALDILTGRTGKANVVSKNSANGSQLFHGRSGCRRNGAQLLVSEGSKTMERSLVHVEMASFLIEGF